MLRKVKRYTRKLQGRTMDIIENELLIVSFNRTGGEVCSIKVKNTGKEYIFEGIPQFWSKTSPILFPIVGCVKNGKYTYLGNEYKMHIHGFANYQDFEVCRKEENYIEYILKSGKRFKEIYPFEFELVLSYRLIGDRLVTGYRVINKSDEDMYFQIGGHTAFVCPLCADEKRADDYLMFKGIRKLDCSRIDMSCGLLKKEHEEILLEECKEYPGYGFLRITDDLFDKDALIGENNQTQEILLAGSDKKPYLAVCFDAPVFGVWSPRERINGGAAPFVCIEPWYGRCDKTDFEGELKDREWINKIGKNEEFYREYTIKMFLD